jgi:hypothetical protein
MENALWNYRYIKKEMKNALSKTSLDPITNENVTTG